ncbi:MAG: chromosome segregation SMC family protein [archaeon]
MAHIKKLVMHGFKSFAKKTEIPFDKGINVIIGPNGSGKSNLSDAICFALGRLSVKSMRAEKAKNLIFMGSKFIKPAKEAYVEIHFDNSDKSFSIEKEEVILKRIVRIKGASIYKINNETKTRAEIIETLGQAGIDPYGFNMILQGQIQSIVKMHGEERRKIIGEVAGISVYEWRKEKSLKELEKTDSRLKEVSIILKQRTAYMNNLEKEKAQAQRYKDLQETVKRAKASILKKKHDDKTKEIEQLIKSIEEKMNQKDKKQAISSKSQEDIDSLSEKINQINKHIRDATGLEQGRLREQITNLRAELEGVKVRKEGHENKRDEIERRIEEMEKSIPELENEIKRLRQESPMMAKKAQEVKKKKEELAELEKERKRVFTLKSELNSLKERLEDKRSLLSKTTGESESLVRQIEELSRKLTHSSLENCTKEITSLKKEISEEKEKIEILRKKEMENEKIISVAEAEQNRNEETKKKVTQIDTCPLCQSKMTKDHIKHVNELCNTKIKNALENFEAARQTLIKIKNRRELSLKKIKDLENKIHSSQKEFSSLKSISEKKTSLKKSVEFEESLRKQVLELESKRKSLEGKTEDFSVLEERYNNKIFEIEEISSRTEEDIDTTLLYKERELEKTKSIIERSKEDLDEIENQISELGENLEDKQSSLEEKEEQEEKLNQKFKKMFQERDETQKKIQETSIRLADIQTEIRQIEDQINYLKIGKAKIEGERETIELDLAEYKGVELLQGSVQNLEERLHKAQNTLNTIGSINMRALEVFEEVKEQYEEVKQKADTLEKEKEEIMKIIEEIDKKKKHTFMKTFKAINSLFSENFSKISAKGKAYLEIENREDIFAGGIDIVVKLAKGKYFDVHSLSGGEQTMVALSLLFAIQEYKPYHFYILDEIDAALDKRNSERLAALLHQYTKKGQYIIVTHNDAVILDSDILYGVSMHEGISKMLSLKVK